MSDFIDTLASVNDVVNDFVWTKVGVWLLIAVGLLMTVLTKCFQVSHLPHWFKKTIGNMFEKKVRSHTGEKASISQFQALCTALAATVGVGNIAGVAGAIVTGGPGAVFWMWVAAFLGMMTNYSENVLGIYYRRKNKAGEWSGGAMYYLQDGLGGKKGFKHIGRILAIIFAICAVLASFGIGNMGQVNKIVINFTSAFDIPALSEVVVFGEGDSAVTLYSIIIGAVLLILVGIVVIGGIKRIANVAEKIIPFMVIMYVLGALIVICVNITSVGKAFGAIFSMAFSSQAVWGGATGVALKQIITMGCKRGVFSNEAGLGSSVMVHSNSNVVEPVKQGLWGIFEVFADTIVICTMTALTILTSGVIDLETGVHTASSDATLVAESFNSVFTFGDFKLGQYFIAIAILLFAFTTVLGWSHYGTKAMEYLAGSKASVATTIYKVLFVIMVMFGATLTSSIAWDISDTFNGMMMLPNLIGVVALSPLVMKLTKNYVDRRIKKLDVPPMLSHFPDIEEMNARIIRETGEE